MIPIPVGMLIVHLLDRGLPWRVASSVLGCRLWSGASAHDHEVGGVDVTTRWDDVIDCRQRVSGQRDVRTREQLVELLRRAGPMSTEVTAGWAVTNPTASWGSVSPASSAIDLSPATTSNFRSTSGRDRSHHVRE